MEGEPPLYDDSQSRSNNDSHYDYLDGPKPRVWVGNIPGYVHLKEFLQAIHFAGLPEVVDVFFKKCPVRSWSFLIFRNEEEAADAISFLDGKRFFSDSELQLEARFANPQKSKDSSSVGSRTKPFAGSFRSEISTRVASSSCNSIHTAPSVENWDELPEADESTLWHVYKDENDIPYYYNKITGCTHWEKPIPPLLAIERATKVADEAAAARDAQIYIYYIPYSWDDKELTMHFTPFGNLVVAKVEKDANGKNTGFGYISYDNHQSAVFAARLMNGYAANSKFLKVELRRS